MQVFPVRWVAGNENKNGINESDVLSLLNKWMLDSYLCLCFVKKPIEDFKIEKIIKDKFNGNIINNGNPDSSKESVTLLNGFPRTISGEIIFCHQDNLNTDGIYPGKYTYIDDFTNEQQAEVVMENYDPNFGKLVSKGNILVGGYNFGTGSSREQAATSLKYRGIQIVLAGSFSQTYKRNAINNGFLVVESPELVNNLKKTFGNKALTVKTGLYSEIDFKNSKIIIAEKEYSIPPVGKAAQELILSKGLENWTKENR